jgi:hypothetical protein
MEEWGTTRFFNKSLPYSQGLYRYIFTEEINELMFGKLEQIILAMQYKPLGQACNIILGFAMHPYLLSYKLMHLYILAAPGRTKYHLATKDIRNY